MRRDRHETSTMTSARGGPRSLATLIPKLVRPAIGKRGFAEAGLIADWPAIAGAEIAVHCRPERLEFPRGERTDGTLHLRVEGAWAVAIQHLEPQLVERINASLGYRAIGRLRLLQAPFVRNPQARAAGEGASNAKAIDPAARKALAEQVAAIEHAELRRAVERLGLALLARSRSE
jgi:hypothetical protein